MPPLAVFHDLRWLFGYAAVLARVRAAAGRADRGPVRAERRAGPAGLARRPAPARGPRGVRARRSTLTMVACLLLSPIVALSVGVAILPFSWPYLGALVVMLLISAAAQPRRDPGLLVAHAAAAPGGVLAAHRLRRAVAGRGGHRPPAAVRRDTGLRPGRGGQRAGPGSAWSGRRPGKPAPSGRPRLACDPPLLRLPLAPLAAVLSIAHGDRDDPAGLRDRPRAAPGGRRSGRHPGRRHRGGRGRPRPAARCPGTAPGPGTGGSMIRSWSSWASGRPAAAGPGRSSRSRPARTCSSSPTAG